MRLRFTLLKVNFPLSKISLLWWFIVLTPAYRGPFPTCRYSTNRHGDRGTLTDVHVNTELISLDVVLVTSHTKYLVKTVTNTSYSNLSPTHHRPTF